MNLLIDDNSTLCEIQQKFRRQFPYLKLQFFSEVKSGNQLFTKENLITDPHVTLGEIRDQHIPGNIRIDNNLKAGILEKKFRQLFGIQMQIFRKFRNAWQQTREIEDCSLAELNSMGEDALNPLRPETGELHCQIR
jgi:hypothetical protein